jgi:hypothetical protein
MKDGVLADMEITIAISSILKIQLQDSYFLARWLSPRIKLMHALT